MTTINVDDETHGVIITLQSVLTLMSGDKPSISETVKYAASSILSGATFTIGGRTHIECRGNEDTSVLTTTTNGYNSETLSNTCNYSSCGNTGLSSGIFFTRSLM
jgi:hypothetical protein